MQRNKFKLYNSTFLAYFDKLKKNSFEMVYLIDHFGLKSSVDILCKFSKMSTVIINARCGINNKEFF